MKKSSAFVLALVSALLIIAVPMSSVQAQETLIWNALVYSSGEPVSSPVLQAGREYRIVAEEIFWYDYANKLAADANYYTIDPTDWWNWLSYSYAGESFLQIDGASVAWGPFSNGDTGHTYEISYTGSGEQIIFTIVDLIDGYYGNNRCHLPVWIYEKLPPTEEGLSPGYWKKAFNAFADLIAGKKPKGTIKETWADLVTWTGQIDGASRSLPTPWDLPPLAEIDYDGDGTFEMEDAYNIFNDHGKPWNQRWIDVANWYNWASGRSPYP